MSEHMAVGGVHSRLKTSQHHFYTDKTFIRHRISPVRVHMQDFVAGHAGAKTLCNVVDRLVI